MQERRYPKRERKRREFPDILYQAVQTGDDQFGEPAVCNEAMKAVKECHSKELQRAREMHSTTEKLHRRRSFNSKTQRIERKKQSVRNQNTKHNDVGS
jgi:hypothetical protein